MKKLFTLLFVVLGFSVLANPVDRNTAQLAARNQYLNSAPQALRGAGITSSYDFKAGSMTAFYVFNFENGGWVMVSADDAVTPILAYSFEGDLNPSNLNPEISSFLEGYKNEINFIVNAQLDNSATVADWKDVLQNKFPKSTNDVAPLVTTNWDQGCYYNALCPVEPAAGLGSCSHAWTGCVATTMAVLMKYNQWPAQGFGAHAYDCQGYGTQTANFAATTYDFAAMPNTVTSANTAVATLMYHAGVSVNMQYGADGSGAYSAEVPFSLINYFNYDPGCKFVSKDDYSSTQWIDLLKAELDAARPMLYSGSSTASGGHAWICDGYRSSDNKFHMNWGWSGSSNGYFAIGSLNPSGMNFNETNGAVIGVKPGNNNLHLAIQNTAFTTASRGVQYVSAVDENVCWISAYDGSGGGTTISEFSRTTDGGLTWTPGKVFNNTTYGIGNISAINGTTAFAAIYNGSGSQNNTCGIYKTTNGGSTWTQLPGALQGSSSFANNVYFWNENEGMCHGDVRDNYFEIYYTTNGGANWTRVPQASFTGTPLAMSGEGGWTSVITAAGDNFIAFGTNKGRVLMSNDRGKTWKITNANITNPNSNGGINMLAAIDENTLIAAETAGTTPQWRRTTNGGTSWETFTPSGTVFTNDLAAVPGTTGTYVLTGADATNNLAGISYTIDNGSTWTVLPATSDKQFLAADFSANANGWIGAFSGDVLGNTNNNGIYKLTGSFTPAAGAQINFNLSAISMNVPKGHQDTTTLVISNTGTEDLVWSASIDPSTTTWVSTVPANGVVTPGNSQDVLVIFDAEGLNVTTYTANLVITSNAGAGTNTLPLTLIVDDNVGIDQAGQDVFAAYPNPASNQVIFNSRENIRTIRLINISGATVADVTVNNNTFTLPVDNFARGLYFMQVTTENGQYVRKIQLK